jgi:hypothetical protein
MVSAKNTCTIGYNVSRRWRQDKSSNLSVFISLKNLCGHGRTGIMGYKYIAIFNGLLQTHII